MYNLQSSDMINRKFINYINNSSERNGHLQKIREVIKNSDLTSISYLIFKELPKSGENEGLFNTICISLTLGDDLSIPIQKDICDILYFSACVNYNSKIDFNIINFTQAKTLFELYDNNYNKIIEDNDDSGKRYSMSTIKANHKYILFPGYSITWKIPVAFYRIEDENNPGKMIQKCTLSGLGYCELIINEETFKIPRVYFIKFFRNSLVKGRLICNNSDEIKACFDENNASALEEIFEYCGFRKMKQLSNILIPQSTIMFNEHNPGHILTYVNVGQINVCNFINDKDQKIFWKELDEGNEGSYKTFELLPNLNYIPLISKYEVFNLMAK